MALLTGCYHRLGVFTNHNWLCKRQRVRGAARPRFSQSETRSVHHSFFADIAEMSEEGGVSERGRVAEGMGVGLIRD